MRRTFSHCHINDHLQEGMVSVTVPGDHLATRLTLAVLNHAQAAVLLEGLDQLPTFKTNLTTKPSGWFPLSNDTVGKILEEGLELFHNVTHWTTPAADDTWGDPRSAASAAEVSCLFCAHVCRTIHTDLVLTLLLFRFRRLPSSRPAWRASVRPLPLPAVRRQDVLHAVPLCQRCVRRCRRSIRALPTGQSLSMPRLSLLHAASVCSVTTAAFLLSFLLVEGSVVRFFRSLPVHTMRCNTHSCLVFCLRSQSQS